MEYSCHAGQATGTGIWDCWCVEPGLAIAKIIHLKNELSYKVIFFCTWLGIHRSYKSVQSFQGGVVRHAQHERKQ